jgi:signal transduction histidine kinase
MRLDDVLAALQPVEGRPDTRHVPATGRFVVPIVFDVEAGGAPARIAVLRDVTAVLESEAARDAFIGMLSHELRTPITTIYGTAQVLRRPLGPEASRELIDDLAAETDRLYRLVEDLLVLSRFERGRLDVASEPVLVHRVVHAALARTAAQHRDLRVEVDAPPGLPPALADATYLEQIIRNLASNGPDPGPHQR